MRRDLIHKVDTLAVFIVGSCLFAGGLGDRELLGFESRFGLFAKEMMRNGVSFFPTVYGNPYADYPSTQTVLTCLVSLAAGKVSIFTVALPTALFAAATLSLTYLIGARRSRAFGICAVLLEVGTYGFLAEARGPSLDHFVTAFTAFTYFIASGRQPAAWPSRWGLVALGLAGGFIFRGPIGLVIPAAVVLAHYAVERDWKSCGIGVIVSLVLLVLCMTALLVAARREGGDDLVQAVTRMQATGRLVREDAKPFYYYLGAGLGEYAVSFPLALLFIAANWKRLAAMATDPEARTLRSLAGWMLIVLAGLSIPMQKKARYLLPLVPAASLLAAHVFTSVQEGRALGFVRKAFAWLCAALPALGLAAAIAAPLIASRLGHPIEAPVAAAALVFCAQIAVGVLVARKVNDETSRRIALLGLGVAALVTLQMAVVEPVTLALEATRPFVKRVEPFFAGGRTLVFYRIGPDAGDVKLMVNTDVIVRPEFASTTEDVAALKAPACIIAETKDALPLRERFTSDLRVVAEGKIGRRDCIAFAFH